LTKIFDLWLAHERGIARTADIQALVRASTDIVIAERPVPDFPRPRRLTLPAPEWLLRSHAAKPGGAAIQLVVGQREDSVARRWRGRPAGPAPGVQPGEPVRSIAFLRFAHDPLPNFAPEVEYRIVDGEVGLLLADRPTIARVRAAIEARAASRTRPRATRGARLAEFT